MTMILKIIYWFFGVLLRKIYSPLIYWFIRFTIYNKKLPNMWNEAKKLPMNNFNRLLNQYKYKPDFWGGFLDSSLQEPDFFFVEGRKYFRDCDDFSQMWFLWATENHLTAWLMVVVDGWRFWRSHMYVILKSNNAEEGIILITPYDIHKGHPDIHTAMNQFKKKDLLMGGKYKNAIHLEYKNNFEQLK